MCRSLYNNHYKTGSKYVNIPNKAYGLQKQYKRNYPNKF